jgi:hypothetical protein
MNDKMMHSDFSPLMIEKRHKTSWSFPDEKQLI